MESERTKYRKHYKLQFADEEIYDKIIGLINNGSVEIQEKNNSDFRKTLTECLRLYEEIVIDTYNDTNIHALLHKICINIKDIVTAVYEGLHNRAYTKLQNLLTQYNDNLYFTLPVDTELYRMRVTDKRKGLERKDIFHNPLNNRRCIKTQRFSTPGYPCLYLGRSLYVCWEEMGMPSTETTLVAGFKNNSELKLVDLRVPSLDTFLNQSEKYVKLFPLILACSIPVINKEDVFKPEYILPQLVLEWTINKRKETSALGVYYTSVFKNQGFFPSLDFEWENIAVPVQYPLATSKFCPRLKELFKLTKPTCYEYEHVLGNIDATGFWDNGPERYRTGDQNKRDYYTSQFSRMEELLLKKKFEDVDNEEAE